MLKDRELWFVIVANPDGYQYTFDVERLWRKNLRDNDGDGEITVADGVDPNRNFNEHWGYDDEGSSPDPTDETYRGPSAGIRARDARHAGPDRPDQAQVHVEPALGRRVDPLPAGLAGRDARRRQPRSTPRSRARTRTRRSPASTPVSRRTRYTSRTARRPTTRTRRPGRSPSRRSSATAIPVAGSCFPDDEALVEAEFQNVLPFHLALARSAIDPDDPVSSVGITRRAVLPRPGRDRPAERVAFTVRFHLRRSRTATRRRCASSRSAASAP